MCCLFILIIVFTVFHINKFFSRAILSKLSNGVDMLRDPSQIPRSLYFYLHFGVGYYASALCFRSCEVHFASQHYQRTGGSFRPSDQWVQLFPWKYHEYHVKRLEAPAARCLPFSAKISWYFQGKSCHVLSWFLGWTSILIVGPLDEQQCWFEIDLATVRKDLAPICQSHEKNLGHNYSALNVPAITGVTTGCNLLVIQRPCRERSYSRSFFLHLYHTSFKFWTFFGVVSHYFLKMYHFLVKFQECLEPCSSGTNSDEFG